MVYTLLNEVARASRWSWDETLRYAGLPKNSIGVVASVEMGDCSSGRTRKTSPPPSQSFAVSIGG